MRCRLLGLSSEETNYGRRGFRGATEGMQTRIEQVGAAFLCGYHAALEHGPEGSGRALDGTSLELLGFAFEGAAMGLALLDGLTPWGASRVSRFLLGAGKPHVYMVHVGVGWVWARLPFGFRRSRQRLDPLLAWLAFDGWGFHEGFFHWPAYIAGQTRRPPRLAGYEVRAFDQGFGRSLWFVNGGNPDLIASTIGNFAAARQADLWSGIGLAAVYAGIVDETALVALRARAGKYGPALAQGGVFATKARQRAGNLTEYTDFAARILCGLPAVEAALLSDTTLENLPANTPEPPYEIWRQRIQEHFKQLGREVPSGAVAERRAELRSELTPLTSAPASAVTPIPSLP